MKKYFLSISFVFCWWLAVAGTGSQNSRPTVFTAVGNECDHSSADARNAPITELELCHHVITMNGGRHQNFQSFIGDTTTAAVDRRCGLIESNKQYHKIFLKKYLAHIYPSHNFW